MKRLVVAFIAALFVLPVSAQKAEAAYCVEFYRDNLFLGLAYHRIACLTDWNTIQSSQDYDGFTNTRYCYSGSTANSVPGGDWYDGACFSSSTSYSAAKGTLDARGSDTNICYDTPNYKDRSNTCSYNVLNDCNSDCWMENFSKRLGYPVDTISGCWGSPPVSSVNGMSCNM